MDYMNKKKYTIRTEVKKFGLYLHHYKRLNDTYLQSDGDDQLLGGSLGWCQSHQMVSHICDIGLLSSSISFREINLFIFSKSISFSTNMHSMNVFAAFFQQ